MTFTTTDDQEEIYFQQHGTTGDTTLVFVSGYFGVTHIWEPLIDRLASRYRCVAYDSRGYGRSSKPTPADAYSIARHAADLHAVLQHLALDRVVLVTHSMGGNIAAEYALTHPDHVQGIVYTAVHFDGQHLATHLPLEAVLAGIDTPSHCVALFTGMGLDAATAHEAAKWPAYALRHNASALLTFAIGDRYSALAVPALVVQGGEDRASPVACCARPVVHAMPSCRLEVLPGVNHFPPTEAPAEVERLVDGFVRGL
ncbi:alpha/beta fold hydrolase [Aspergillus homomorphus CBS 101889]|uniref:Putative alpha/beta fold family hydrolase n=1 Tax=Aspergillus homomorphus (strain CBS 101889) TaxID=1450537 RepID=A0A395I7C4_ASPHC|nr:putative alpha/beta fold family hydrolase [Aspergillus homomorphus CBS 101889]RAL14998.1 putative alpha/beta fold family hydrolase [Aspergillus homomorphus CBS 101889]